MMKDTIKTLGVMIDCSRNGVYTVETLKTMFSLLAKMGYNYVQLYTEDTYEIEGEPCFGYLRGRYSKADLKELDAAAQACGLELVPCIQTLAHLSGVTRWPQYHDCTDTGDILLAGEEKTYALIEKMFAACAECFTSRRINIGMDEAHMVGLGKYLDRHGYESRFEILLRHLNRVAEIAERYGFSPMMWSDMFFRLMSGGEYYCASGTIPQAVKDLVPKNVSLIYWDYYSTDRSHYDQMLRAHRQFDNPVLFAGGAWSWSGFTPANRFSIRANEAAMRSCLENGIDDVFITCWKDDGAECSLFSSLPSLFAAAQFARGNFDGADIARKFRALTGIDMETFLEADDVDLHGGELQNPSKYLLYSDPFLGFLDRTAIGTEPETFPKIGKALSAGAASRRYGYLFRTLMALCDVLEIKATLGLRTRELYRKGDKEALSALIGEYRELERRLETFYRRFREQWDRECRENGFEMHDIRLGGLIRRVRHCRRMLADYVCGKRASLPALEEEICPYAGCADGKAVMNNDWLYISMIKPRT